MAFVLNKRAVEHARKLIREGRFVSDCGEVWSAHRATAGQESAFWREHGPADYGRWHLGIDTDEDEDTRARYAFPVGDFARTHRCELLLAESLAQELGCIAIARAARQLHDQIDVVNAQHEAER